MEKKIRVAFCSDLDYEEMVADVHYEENYFALITQENGIENMQIEIFPRPDNKNWVFKFSEFEEAILFAKNRLWELRKIPEEGVNGETDKNYTD